MGLEEVANQWKNEMFVLGLEIDCSSLECIEEIINDERDPISVVKDVRNEMFISVKSDEVTKFFYDIFDEEELAYHFAFNYGLFVDITESGEVVVKDNVEPDLLSKPLMEMALKELLGEEKINSVIMMDIFDKEKIKNTLDFEIEERLKKHFGTLGKQVETKLYELEEKLVNEII